MGFEWWSLTLLLCESRLLPLGDDLRVLLLLLLLVRADGVIFDRGVGRLLVSDGLVSWRGSVSDDRLVMRHLCRKRGTTCTHRPARR